MSVDLQPNTQLAFHRPLTQLVKRTLLISNNNSQPVTFKVKTTAPKQYCVRPNSGRIEPNERVEVQVLLQPMKEEPPTGYKCKDKFLVQSSIISPDKETKTLAELWSTIEADVKSGKDGAVHEQKIRCVYLAPIDGDDASQTSGTVASAGDQTADMSSNDFRSASPSASGFVANGSTPARYEDSRTAPSSVISHQQPVGGNAGGAERGINGSSSNSDGLPANAPVMDKIKAAVPTTTEEAKAAASSAATAVSAAAVGAAASVGLTKGEPVSADTATLQKELQEARAEIQRLKKQLSDSTASEGLRQRNVAGSTDSKSGSAVGPGAATATVTQEGLPLPMVGALCAGVFVFTWLFL